jgi:hypothetical protein
MKRHNDFRWIPCGLSASNVDDCLVDVVSAEILPTPQHAVMVVLELTLLASMARSEELAMVSRAKALPVIQIG